MNENIMNYTEQQIWALEEFDKLELKEGSQSKASQKIGISDGIVSRLRKGKYTGDIDKQFNILIQYFEVKTENEKIFKTDDYLETSISTEIYDYIRRCQIKGGLMAISGDAGIGKSRTIRKFAQDNQSSTIWITANPCLNTVKPILKMLSRKLNVIAKTNDDMYLGISEKLKDGMVIIVDEAQLLSINVIETLRGFSDYFSDNGMTLGIVFIGNSTTINKFGAKESAVFEQIENRTIQKPVFSTKDILKDDIKLLFPQLEEKEMELDFMLSVARSRQGIRGAKNLFSESYDNNNITYDGLVAMAKHMNLVL